MRIGPAVLASAVVLSCTEPARISTPADVNRREDFQEAPPPCKDCVLGPLELSTKSGQNGVYTTEFKAVQGEYKLLIDSDDQPGGLLELELNGVALPVIKSQKTPISGPLSLDVRLLIVNQLKARLLGRRDLRFVLEIPRPFPPGACPALTGFLTHPTTPPDLLAAIVPLGNLNPPEHVIPTHHLYMRPPASGGAGPLPAYAPYTARIVAIGRDDIRGDYYLYLAICEGLRMYLIHIAELAPRLAWLAAAPFGGFPLGPGFFKLVIVDVAPNELLGYASATYGPYDLGMVDLRRPPLAFANPSRYEISAELLATLPPGIPMELVNLIAPTRLQQFCAIDYFTPTVRASLEPLLGSFDGATRRTVPPICGEHMQDLPGTAQGNWFGDETGGAIPERNRIALVHDNVDPTIPTFSISNEFPFWSAGDWRFVPAATGFVNRDFSAVVPGNVYCYEGMRVGAINSGTVLIEVFGTGGDPANRLRIERPGVPACGAGPWAFTTAAAVFQR
jgi:hypothetical protein